MVYEQLAPLDKSSMKYGFTLIELSVVLVIIGLLVGGILTGQDLIKAAKDRAQVSQIQKYMTAVNVFETKYGGLPGDISLAKAGTFGFSVPASCVGTQGERDGNGLIDGWQSPYVYAQVDGETALFWQDLSAAGLIEGTFPNNGAPATICGSSNAYGLSLASGTAYVGDYFPEAKIGSGNFVYVFEYNVSNWYGVSAINTIAAGDGGCSICNSTISVMDAYNIDKKIDDGLPATGAVVASLILTEPSTTMVTSPNAAADSAATCYNTSTPAGVYSTGYHQGKGINCSLAFQFN